MIIGIIIFVLGLILITLFDIVLESFFGELCSFVLVLVGAILILANIPTRDIPEAEIIKIQTDTITIEKVDTVYIYPQ